jgi:hypothetical protein
MRSTSAQALVFSDERRSRSRTWSRAEVAAATYMARLLIQLSPDRAAVRVAVGGRWWRQAATIEVRLFDKQSAQRLPRVTDDSGLVEWCHGGVLGPVPVSEQPRQAGAPARSERMAG